MALDYEKAFNRVNCAMMWKILEKKRVSKILVRALQSMYVETKTKINKNNKKGKIDLPGC